MFLVSGYLLPLLLIVGLYSVMLHKLWNQVNFVGRGEGLIFFSCPDTSFLSSSLSVSTTRSCSTISQTRSVFRGGVGVDMLLCVRVPAPPPPHWGPLLDHATQALEPGQCFKKRWGLICFFVSGYLLPLLLIVGLYSVMLHKLWNQVSDSGRGGS